MDRLLILAGALAPLVALVVIGRLLRRGGLLGEAASAELGRLLFWVLLPARLFSECARTDVRVAFDPAALGAAVLTFVALLVGGWFLTRSLDPAARGTALTGAGRANAAFVGLPVITLVAATLPAGTGAELAATFAIALAAMVITFNVGSVVAFRLPHHGLGWSGLLRCLGELPKNPLILACAGGALLGAWHPGALVGTWPGSALDLLGAAAVPLALLLTGADLDLGVVRRRSLLVGLVAAAKLIVAPAITYALCRAFGAGPSATLAITVLMACPTAVAAGAMARQLGGDDKLMAAVVVATTAASPITLLVWLALLA